jgi:hypothetical protein
MKWEIDGADAKTGENVHIKVDAQNQVEAIHEAKIQGVFVSQVRAVTEKKVQVRSGSDGMMQLLARAVTEKKVQAGPPLEEREIRPKYASGRKRILLEVALSVVLVAAAVLVTLYFVFPKKPAEPDVSFNAFAARFVPQLQKAYASRPFDPSKPWPDMVKITGKYTIDVEKTDSLVSPFIGTLVVPEKVWIPGFPDGDKPVELVELWGDDKTPNTYLEETFHFALQEDKWNLTQAVRTYIDDGTIKLTAQLLNHVPATALADAATIQTVIAATDARR